MKVVELEKGPDGVYRSKRVIEEPFIRKKKAAPVPDCPPKDPLRDIIDVFEAVKGTANAIAKLIK